MSCYVVTMEIIADTFFFRQIIKNARGSTKVLTSFARNLRKRLSANVTQI